MIELILTFILVWCIVTILHEYIHYFIARKQDANPSIKIWLYKGFIPSMKCTYAKKLSNPEVFYYGAGIGAAIITLPLAYLIHPFYCRIGISLFVAGVMQWFYGLYEGYYYKEDIDKYMIGHYIIYIISFIIAVYMVWDKILLCV